ncbi:MAG TPA: hypothetical protein VKA26_00960 [Ignavibacteriaceae bacterium]|nr:hypothetical protein [Ignavibacteriaceae bacterium]
MLLDILIKIIPLVKEAVAKSDPNLKSILGLCMKRGVYPENYSQAYNFQRVRGYVVNQKHYEDRK